MPLAAVLLPFVIGKGVALRAHPPFASVLGGFVVALIAEGWQFHCRIFPVTPRGPAESK